MHFDSVRGSMTFIDPEGFPWALEVPSGSRFPMETVHIDLAYPEFRAGGRALDPRVSSVS